MIIHVTIIIKIASTETTDWTAACPITSYNCQTNILRVVSSKQFFFCFYSTIQANSSLFYDKITYVSVELVSVYRKCVVSYVKWNKKVVVYYKSVFFWLFLWIVRVVWRQTHIMRVIDWLNHLGRYSCLVVCWNCVCELIINNDILLW